MNRPLASSPERCAVVGAAALAEAQRVLDRAAARILEARRNRNTIRATTGCDGCAGERGADESASLVDREQIPVLGGDRDSGRSGSA
jgi:hypothetical protein